MAVTTWPKACVCPAWLDLLSDMDELQSMFAQGERNLIHYVPTLGNKSPGWEYPDGDGYASLPMAMLYANRRHLPKPVHAFMGWVEGVMAPYLARDTK